MLIGITINDAVGEEYKSLCGKLGMVLSDRIEILIKQDIPVLKELIKKQKVI
jgi:antitoxin component of RelBE/YafQ-DinJ toxin-antitoxin module